MDIVSLETPRLILKRITPGIIHQLFENTTEDEIKDFFGADQAGFEKLADMHKNGMETYRFSLCYFLMLEKIGNKVLGECGFHSWNKTHRRAELFYILKKDDHKRKGFTTEALIPVLEYGFEEMKLHRVEALIARWNEASIAVVKKFGFTKEGIRREDHYIDGKNEDSELYSLLADEWKAISRKL